MEHEQKLTEQQRTALSQLETLRIEMHRVVDERVDGSIHRILLGGVLNIAPTLPLTANSAAFKGEKPESILFPGGREVKTPTWKTAVLAIMQDCNEDPVMHAHLMGLRGKVLGRQRTILAASPEKMHAPLEIDKDLYMESYYDNRNAFVCAEKPGAGRGRLQLFRHSRPVPTGADAGRNAGADIRHG